SSCSGSRGGTSSASRCRRWCRTSPSTTVGSTSGPGPRSPDEPELQVLDELLEQLSFLGGSVALRLFAEQRQDVDGFAGLLEVHLHLPGERIRRLLKGERRRAGEPDERAGEAPARIRARARRRRRPRAGGRD